MRVLLAGGGTAGHTSPLLATADALRRLDPASRSPASAPPGAWRPRWSRRPATRWSWCRRCRCRAGLTPTCARPRPAARAPSARARRARPGRPDVVVGFGGYVSVPAYLAARARQRPARRARGQRRCPASPTSSARGSPATSPPASRTPGCRTRATSACRSAGMIATLDRAALARRGARRFGLDADRPTLLVTGGSQGARRLNSAVVGAPRPRSPRPASRCCTSPARRARPRRRRGRATRRTSCVPFVDRMDLAYAAADLVLCRAGREHRDRGGRGRAAGGVRPAADRQRRAGAERRARGRRRRRAAGGRRGAHPGVGGATVLPTCSPTPTGSPRCPGGRGPDAARRGRRWRDRARRCGGADERAGPRRAAAGRPSWAGCTSSASAAPGCPASRGSCSPAASRCQRQRRQASSPPEALRPSAPVHVGHARRARARRRHGGGLDRGARGQPRGRRGRAARAAAAAPVGGARLGDAGSPGGRGRRHPRQDHHDVAADGRRCSTAAPTRRSRSAASSATTGLNAARRHAGSCSSPRPTRATAPSSSTRRTPRSSPTSRPTTSTTTATDEAYRAAFVDVPRPHRPRRVPGRLRRRPGRRRARRTRRDRGAGGRPSASRAEADVRADGRRVRGLAPRRSPWSSGGRRSARCGCGSRAATTSWTRWPRWPPACGSGFRFDELRARPRRVHRHPAPDGAQGRGGGVRVFDSYAHHPREIAGDLEAARGAGRDRAGWSSRSSRTWSPGPAIFGAEMGDALGAADEVW